MPGIADKFTQSSHACMAWADRIERNPLYHERRLLRRMCRCMQGGDDAGRNIRECAEDGAALFRTDVAVGNALLRQHLLLEGLIACHAFEALAQGRDRRSLRL